MPHKQLAFVVLAVWRRFCFIWPFAPLPSLFLLIHSLPLPSSSPSLCPSVHYSTPCPVLWEACQVWVWLHSTLCWETASSLCRASGLCRMSPGVSLSFSLLGCGSARAWVLACHLAPVTPDLISTGSTRSHINCPFASFTVKAPFRSAVEFATVHP